MKDFLYRVRVTSVDEYLVEAETGLEAAEIVLGGQAPVSTQDTTGLDIHCLGEVDEDDS